MSRPAPLRERIERTRFVAVAWFQQISEFIVLAKMDRLQRGTAGRFDRWALAGLHRLMLRQVARMRARARPDFAAPAPATAAGVHNAEVQLRASDPQWADAARAEIETLQRALGPGAIVHHIGSTAVETLDAKPIIDLALALPTEDFDRRLHAATAELARLGYRYVGVRGGLFFEKGPFPVRTHALQVHAADSAVLAEILRFRAALREDAVLRAEYLAVKRALARQFPTQRMHYAVYKSRWIDEQQWSRAGAASWVDWFLGQKRARDALARARRQR